MYESFFEFNARPFDTAPYVDRYFPAAVISQARETLTRVVERSEGPGLIIGPAGTGKTLLCHVLANQFRRQFRVATLASARLCTRRAMLQNILFELKLPYRSLDEGELRLSLIDHLEPRESCPNGLLLLVDEAHNLPLRLLEELRMLTNLVRENQTRVRLVLAASPALEERLASPRLESFNQRIAARCYLQSLNKDETTGYVQSQCSAVGAEAHEIFDGSAMEAIYQASDGVPRLVNQICDHSLILAYSCQQKPVVGNLVEEAWADLQQLPTPWSSASTATEFPSEILEFGPLDEAEQAADDEQETMIVEWPRKDEIQEAQLLGELDEIDLGDAQMANAPVDPDEFTPAGTILPEIELMFDDSTNPFNETFEDEEIVVDQQAARQAEQVQMPWIVSDPIQVNIQYEPAEGESSELAVQSQTVIEPATIQWEDELASEHEELDTDVDDRDMIVIDDRTDQESEGTPAPKSVRRKQYRQLFASLRQNADR